MHAKNYSFIAFSPIWVKVSEIKIHNFLKFEQLRLLLHPHQKHTSSLNIVIAFINHKYVFRHDLFWSQFRSFQFQLVVYQARTSLDVKAHII